MGGGEQRFGAYRVTRLLGRGGMGEVWLAVHTETREPCALKTIRSDLASSGQARAMLLDEARIARRLQHRNIARALDEGIHDETTPFFVMEWVPGISLRELLVDDGEERTSKVPLRIALRIVADACSGLDAAHELRSPEGKPLELVHRDVSPHNILISFAGTTKLIDFGVAKMRERVCGDTSTGIIKGKVRYMAPEQALSKKLDRRTDIFAMGGVLFHLVTGQAAFEGDNDLAILRLLLSPNALTIPSSVPPPVAKILSRALASSPSARFASAREMATAIEAVLTELGEETTESDVADFLLASGHRPEAASSVVVLDALTTLTSLTGTTVASIHPPAKLLATMVKPQAQAAPPTKKKAFARLGVVIASAAVAAGVTVSLIASAQQPSTHSPSSSQQASPPPPPVPPPPPPALSSDDVVVGVTPVSSVAAAAIGMRDPPTTSVPNTAGGPAKPVKKRSPLAGRGAASPARSQTPTPTPTTGADDLSTSLHDRR